MKLVSVFLLLLAPLLTSCQRPLQPVDCSAIYQQDKSKPSGVYTIYPAGKMSAIKVYCDMTSEGGRWTVFQKRMDGTVNFYRGWDQYKSGFGNPAGEYWLGPEVDGCEKNTDQSPGKSLVKKPSQKKKICQKTVEAMVPPIVKAKRPWSEAERSAVNKHMAKFIAERRVPGLDNIHYLTNNKKSELLVDMEDFEGNKVFARYSSFSVGAERDGFVLNVSGFIDGGAGDSLSYHNGMKFSTFDKDQDISEENCASSHLGAFWYHDCHDTNPNGVYQWGAETTLVEVGMDWDHWKGHNFSLKAISMKIRPVL